MKTCNKCKQDKDEAEYGKRSASVDGLTYQCRACRAIIRKNSYQRNREKTLIACKIYNEKNKDKIAADKKLYYIKNKEIITRTVKKYKINNRDQYLARGKRYRDNNKEKIKVITDEWYKNNKERKAETGAAWEKNNSGARSAYTAKYRSFRIKATPAWHETKKIFDLYLLAKKITDWGCKVHIDHIVPLNNNLVCGLHCLDNLQILTAYQNHSKGNKYG